MSPATLSPATLVPPGLVAPPLLLAVLAEAAAWALAAQAGTLGPGFWYGRGDLLAAVHLVTVGTLATAIVGAGWQLVPVVTTRPAGRAWAPVARVVNGLVALGLVGLVAGFLRHGPWLVGGATLLVGGLLLRGAVVVPALLRGVGRRAVRGWLLAAEASLLLGLGLALVLAAERAGASVLPDRVQGIGLHAALLLGGWVGGWMIGLGSLLLPMFAVSPEPRPTLLALAGLCWFGGTWLALPPLWALGALLSAGGLLHALSRRARRQPEAGIVGAAVALLALAALALALALGAPAPAVVTAALLCWALPFLRGVALRILPFLVWVHGLGDRGGRAPTVGSLVHPGLAGLAVGSGLLAGLLVLGGGVLGAWTLARAGALLGLLGALSTLVVLGVALARALHHRRLGQTLPGMERR
ncbi:hypothetical protein L6R53_09140 [Myxococcota bacterium]|nr:hypothetical protein [Myxococcota bacterium]